MSRAMPLTGYSVEAEMSASADVKARVEIVVLGILRSLGEATHDEIGREYDQRAEQYPGIPRVSPQRVRSATSRLKVRGLVVVSLIPGVSDRGHPATNWTLSLPRAAA